MRWLDGTTNAMNMNLGKLREMVRNREACVLQPMGSQESDATGPLDNNNNNNGKMTMGTWKSSLKNVFILK